MQLPGLALSLAIGHFDAVQNRRKPGWLHSFGRLSTMRKLAIRRVCGQCRGCLSMVNCQTDWTTAIGQSRSSPKRSTKGCTAMARSPRDIERIYSTHEVVAKLRRLADALEKDESFRIQIAGVRIRVPERAQFSIEHELEDDEEEIEFQFKWKVEPGSQVESEEGSVV